MGGRYEEFYINLLANDIYTQKYGTTYKIKTIVRNKWK